MNDYKYPIRIGRDIIKDLKIAAVQDGYNNAAELIRDIILQYLKDRTKKPSEVLIEVYCTVCQDLNDSFKFSLDGIHSSDQLVDEVASHMHNTDYSCKECGASSERIELEDTHQDIFKK